MFKDQQAVVIDSGSNFSKVGFSGEVNPRKCFPTIIGKSKFTIFLGGKYNQVYIGEEAITKAQYGYLTLIHPIQDGIVQNFDDMEKIWHHAFFNQLSINPKDYPTFITEAPMNPQAKREKTVEIMFETFNVPQFYMAIQPILAFQASGRKTGVVVDSGADATYVIPINDLCYVPNKVQKSRLGGSECTIYLSSILNDINLSFTSFDMEVTREIKEKFCYVTQDYCQEMEKYKHSNVYSKPYLLPDDNVVIVENQRFRCPEILFNSKSLQSQWQTPGIHELVHQSIMRCNNPDLQNEYYNNILLSGGTTMFSGFPERLGKELKNLAPEFTKIKVIAPFERNFYAWKGGAFMASLSSTKWITKEEYNDRGPQIIHQRCQNC